MGVFGKMAIEVDIKHRGDVFHELFKTNPHKVSDIVPDQIHSCEVHDGEFGKIGSTIQWEYTLHGKKCIVREIIEEIDEENKIMRFKIIEGSDVLEDYKTMRLSLHVIQKGDFDAVMWELDFERFQDYGPYPNDLIDFLIKMTRDLEAHHC